jgi:hypothetical protein
MSQYSTKPILSSAGMGWFPTTASSAASVGLDVYWTFLVSSERLTLSHRRFNGWARRVTPMRTRCSLVVILYYTLKLIKPSRRYMMSRKRWNPCPVIRTSSMNCSLLIHSLLTDFTFSRAKIPVLRVIEDRNTIRLTKCSNVVPPTGYCYQLVIAKWRPTINLPQTAESFLKI